MRCEYNERKEVEHENSPKLTCMAEAIAARMTEVPIVPEITREGGLGSRDFGFIKKNGHFFFPLSLFLLSPLSFEYSLIPRINMKSSLSIPPLPTSKRIKTSTHLNKENESSNACQSVVQGDAKRPLTSSANSPTKPAVTSSPLDKNNVSTLNTSISANGTPLRSRVLRMGETVEDLFCLIPPFETEESLKHLKLCEDIANDIDGSSNSLIKWRVALEVSISQNERFASGENANEIKSNLLRLHKRAASRFFSYKVENENDRKNILAIFLLYAKAQSLHGSIESAINTYRLIQTKGIGDKDANLYIHMAEFELEHDKSVEAMDNALNTLENGLSRGAVPKDSLDEFKERIHDMKKAVLNNNADGDRIRPTNVSHSNPTSSSIPSLNKSRLARVPRPNRLKSSSIRVGGVQRITSLTGPKRVNATIAHHDEDEEEDDEDDNIPIDPNKKIKLDILEKTPPKITKSDISYLLNWNPTGPGSGSTESKKEYDTNLPINVVAIETSSSKHSQRAIYAPELNRIEESNRENSASTNNSGSLNSSKSQHSSIHSQSSNERKDETSEPLPAVQSEKSPAIPNSADTSAIVNDDPATKCHPDFIPIFSRQNVISVNREPYVKLGVIGKGGSCKVYRTLSRDRQIVAIKKVKLAGMSKKSIEGYANEISLLRRLRGNPAIIQMYDSEVDLQRKAIYLVMELGEVDLNHVVSVFPAFPSFTHQQH